MKEEQKEDFLHKLLSTLIITFGIPLLEKVLDKHKDEIAASSTGDPLPPDPTHPPKP